MGTCTVCASLKAHSGSEPHPALRRRGVSHRFLDVFETYVCLECGANWERAVIEDTHAISYRWALTAEPMNTGILSIPHAGCTDLDQALASWIRRPIEDQVEA